MERQKGNRRAQISVETSEMSSFFPTFICSLLSSLCLTGCPGPWLQETRGWEWEARVHTVRRMAAAAVRTLARAREHIW